MTTAKEFISYVLIPYREGWGYIYGTSGQTWTEAKQKAIQKTTDEGREMSRKVGGQWIGKMVTDCSGLPRWALAQLGETVVHHARYQYTSECKNKGILSGGLRADGTRPLPGSLVFIKSNKEHIHHVGVYVGGGTVIEAKGAAYGVVTSDLPRWEYWGELKCVDYTDAAALEDEPLPEIEAAKPAAQLLAVIKNNPSTFVNLRFGPSSATARLAQIAKGERVEVIAQDNPAWWRVKYRSLTGWIYAEYLEIIEPAAQDQPAEETKPAETLMESGEPTLIDDEERELIISHLDNLRLALITMTSQVATIINLLKNQEGGP